MKSSARDLVLPVPAEDDVVSGFELGTVSLFADLPKAKPFVLGVVVAAASDPNLNPEAGVTGVPDDRDPKAKPVLEVVSGLEDCSVLAGSSARKILELNISMSKL